MNYLTLDLIRQHLNIEQDFTEDDKYLGHLGSVVEVVVEKDIDNSLETLAELDGGELPLPLIQAMLLLLGTYYANRENIAFSNGTEVPKTYEYLTALYRRYFKEDEGNMLTEIKEMMAKLENQVNSINEYIETDKQKTVSAGSGINVTGDLNKTVSVGDIDEGDY